MLRHALNIDYVKEDSNLNQDSEYSMPQRYLQRPSVLDCYFRIHLIDKAFVKCFFVWHSTPSTKSLVIKGPSIPLYPESILRTFVFQANITHKYHSNPYKSPVSHSYNPEWLHSRRITRRLETNSVSVSDNLRYASLTLSKRRRVSIL